VKLQAAGNLKAAHEAMQAAALATRESLKLKHPWSEREQRELDAILRGPSSDEARDRVQQALGWHSAVIGTMESRSDSGARGAARADKAKFNREVEEALAEIPLPTKRGERRAAAEKHLKEDHVELWKGRRREGLQGVEPLVITPWFRERMRRSAKLRAERLASKTHRLAKNRR
jgi:hypothetical protein